MQMNAGKALKMTFRAFEVLARLTGLGFDYLVWKNHLPFSSSFKKVFKKRFHEPFPVRLREKLEELGPTYVKIGQIIGLRTDIAPPEICRELEKLYYSVPPFSGEEAKKTIEEELKRPVDDIFLSISEKPIGSASLGQVHYGILKSVKEVAVKVKRPGIDELIEHDLALFRLTAGVLERFFPKLRTLNLKKAVDEIEDSMKRELDFMTEAENAQKIRDNLRDHKNVKIPKIFWEYSTRKVLTMEYVSGVSINKLDQQNHIRVNKKKILSIICGAVLKQMFEDGFFHADPHPGNLLVLKNDILSFLDFGMVGHLDEAMRRKMAMAFIDMINNDIESYTRHLLDLAEVRDGADVEEFKKEIRKINSTPSSNSADPESSSLAQNFFKGLDAGARYGINFSPDLTMFIKAMITLEGVAAKLDPNFSLAREARPFVESLISKIYNVREFVNSLEEVGSKYLSFMDRLLILSMRVLKASGEGALLDENDLQVKPREKIDFKKAEDKPNGWLILLLFSLGAVLTYFPKGPIILQLPLFSWLLFAAGFILLIKRK